MSWRVVLVGRNPETIRPVPLNWTTRITKVAAERQARFVHVTLVAASVAATRPLPDAEGDLVAMPPLLVNVIVERVP